MTGAIFAPRRDGTRRPIGLQERARDGEAKKKKLLLPPFVFSIRKSVQITVLDEIGIVLISEGENETRIGYMSNAPSEREIGYGNYYHYEFSEGYKTLIMVLLVSFFFSSSSVSWSFSVFSL